MTTTVVGMLADDDGLVTWQQVADTLPPDILADIVAGPPPSRLMRAGRALSAWWNRPRGNAAVIASVAGSYASTIRAITGPELPGLRTLNDYSSRRNG